MAKLIETRQVVCPRCRVDCGSIGNLGVHLLDLHARSICPTFTIGDGDSEMNALNHELLSKDAEEALGRLIQQGGPRAGEARNFLVESNLRLVVAFVMKGRHHSSRVPDLIQEGNVGLMRAAELFDPSKGFRFTTYAVWWIRQAIQRGTGDHDIVAIPENFRWKRAKAKQLLLQGATPEAVAEELKLSTRSLRAALNAQTSRTISLDQSAAGDEGHALGKILAADEAPIQSLTRDELGRVLYGLRTKERLVLVRRFGLDGKPPLTLQEVSHELGVCRERIRQIEDQALFKLKQRHDRTGTLLGDFTERRFRKGNAETNAIAAAVDRSDGGIRMEANMADLKCELCPGLDFANPQALGAHRRHKHPGTAKPRSAKRDKPDKGDGSVQENPDLPMARPRKTKKGRRPKTKLARAGKSSGGIMASVVAMLQDKRTQRIAELTASDKQLAEIDRTIAALEGHPI